MEMYKMGGSCRDAKGLFFVSSPPLSLTIKHQRTQLFTPYYIYK